MQQPLWTWNASDELATVWLASRRQLLIARYVQVVIFFLLIIIIIIPIITIIVIIIITWIEVVVVDSQDKFGCARAHERGRGVTVPP
jgi:hypothetical protein